MTINHLLDVINKDVKERLEAQKKEHEKADALLQAHFFLQELERIESLPNCNDCKRQGCEYKPKPGDYVRFNCPLHKASAV